MQAILLWAVLAGGISGAVAVPVLGEQLQTQSLNPLWKFATDPDKVGADQEWFAPSFDDSNWAELRTDKGVGWEMQGFGGYVGFGWYRQKVTVSPEIDLQHIYLYFEAVDEEAWIYINGKLAFEHSCETTGLTPNELWVKPFAFDAKEHIQIGEVNTVAVQVFNETGMGGIYRPVDLIASDKALEVDDLATLPLRGDNRDFILGKFAIDPNEEHIYGISFEVRGAPGTVVVSRYYRTFREDGTERQKVTTGGHAISACLRIPVDESWQPGNVEVFTKRGAASLLVVMHRDGGEVAIRNVRLVEGGFPEQPPLFGPPYLKWINSLQANRDIAKANPLLTFGNPDATGISMSGPRHASVNIQLPDAEVSTVQQEVQAYLEVPVERLIQLMPQRRPFPFEVRYSYRLQYREKSEEGLLKVKSAAPQVPIWDPREPDVLRKQDGTVFDYEAEYPVTGYEKVATPDGQIVEYPYHDPPGVDTSTGPPEGRVYLDRFMTAARVSEMGHAAYRMAALYRKTGNLEYGLRSAGILWALARAIPQWPIYGTPGSGDPHRKFYPPDTYEHWFASIINTWYIPNFGQMIWPVRTYDLIREAPVWDSTSQITGRDDPRADIEAALLHVTRMVLKYDAYQRTNPWVFYHNTICTELQTMIDIGRAIGCPELVHYAVQKMRGAFRYAVMADGMFPESASYVHDFVAGLSVRPVGSLEGYADPPGFVATIDGRHIEAFDPAKEIPICGRALAVMHRLYYPNGALLTMHDTWPYTGWPQRPEPKPFLLPDFGHAILGWGQKPNWAEAHLHYSGYYNHGHGDYLNFVLWAYGDELTSDIGYTHQNQYPTATISHNLVVVNGENQMRYGQHVGDLLAWYSLPDAAQIVQASAPAAYQTASRYRRGIVTLPRGPGQAAVVDIFEVQGGQRHEWMANGCADYEQNVETDLVTTQELDNLAADGKALTRPQPQQVSDMPGQKSHFYGAFRNARVGDNVRPWQVTMTAGPPVPEGTPGAVARATSQDPKAGLRLHWLAPLDGQAILCEAPRNRYYRELPNFEAALDAWSRDLMPKVIVRRDGTDLDSTFVAVWEPFAGQPWLSAVNLLPDIPAEQGVGVALTAEDMQATILYRRPESTATLRTEGLSTDGRFTVVRVEDKETYLDLYDGTHATAGPVMVTLRPPSALPVLSVGEENGEHYVIVRGELPDYPRDVAGQPHAGQFIRFTQEGQSSRWLPLQRIEPDGDGQWRLVLTREPGFTFDAPRKSLRELCVPYRTLFGAATVTLPSWMNVRWHPVTDDGVQLWVRASYDVRLRLKGLEKMSKAQARAESSETWIDVPVQRVDGDSVIVLPISVVGADWCTVRLW